MGSGKSTIGKKLGEKLETSFTDTDYFIEKKESLSISKMFSLYGEQYFRDLETNSLTKIESRIIATGGGVIERKENIETMRKNGFVIFLDVPFSEICRRLKNDTTRPLWNQDIEKSKVLFNNRLPKYKKAAHYIVNTIGKEKDEIVSEICKQITEYHID